MSHERYALILAGGSGTRFWPLSRDRRPKQLLQLFDDETLIEKTIHRLERVMPRERIFILTNPVQLEETKRVANLPEGNVFAEPAKRDTAPAVALGIAWIARQNPNATMAILPSDQLIQDEQGFAEVLENAMSAAEEAKHLVTIGIKPTWPCPSYGYIERGDPFEGDGPPTVKVKRFREKPSPDLAQEFIDQGNFTWNAGMFIWSIPTAIEELHLHGPELAAFIETVRDAEDFQTAVSEGFEKMPKTSIDYALMEKSERILNIEGSFDWDDVGNWEAVSKYLKTDKDGNNELGEISKLDSSGNIVYSKTDQHIGLMGVDNLIIVQTKDALLIADRNSADQIKKLVDLLPRELCE